MWRICTHFLFFCGVKCYNKKLGIEIPLENGDSRYNETERLHVLSFDTITDE